MLGRTLHHYQILEKLGQGGMGIVYKARDTKLDRLVAIKMLTASGSSDDDQKARFFQEARAASAIDHPNIGGIYQIDETADGDLFIAMAYYEGETLKQKISRGSLPLESIVDIGEQIARGISRAHSLGIIHRDLKPANVILTADGTPKIIDFGLAKFMAGAQLTRSGVSMGTIAYMAPEQMRGEVVGKGADLWSFGVILFEMCTGNLPFRGDFETALMYSIANEPPLPISQYRGDLPESLQAVVSRLLEKNPANRFVSMDEVEQILHRIRDGLPAVFEVRPPLPESQRTPGPTPSGGEIKPVPEKIVRRKSLLILGTMVTLAAIVLMVWYWKAHERQQNSGGTLSKSVAILPLRNLGDRDYDYLAEGIAIDLVGRLSASPEVLVISRRSALRYRNTQATDSAIAAGLGVRYLVHGELTMLAARLALRLSMYDAESQGVVWTQAYDQPRAEIRTITSLALSDVFTQLDVTPESVSLRLQTSPAVYESYLHGLFYRDRYTKDDNLLALTYFSEAVGGDSAFIPARLGLINTQLEQFLSGWDPSPAFLAGAEAECREILRRDSTNATARAMIGQVLHLRGENDEGLRQLQNALHDDPNNSYALATLGTLYITELNEPLKGMVLLKKLREIDPDDWLSTTSLGVAFAQNKNYVEAEQMFRRASELNASHAYPLYNLAYLFERLARFDSAETHYRSALKRDPRFRLAYSALASFLITQGRYHEADTLISTGLRYLQGDYEMYYLSGLNFQLLGKAGVAQQRFKEGQRLVQKAIDDDPAVPEYLAYQALFAARMGNPTLASSLAGKMAGLDSTHEESVLLISRIYAALGNKAAMLRWFGSAKRMNPEYDEAFLQSAIDFSPYRRDPDLLVVARL